MKKLLTSALLVLMLLMPIVSGCQNGDLSENEIEINANTINNFLLINEKKPPENGSPDDYTPLENLEFTAYKFNRASTWESYYSGEVTSLGVKQQVRNRRIYDNCVLFNEAISASMLKQIAEQKFYSSKIVLLRPSLKIDRKSLSATWRDTITKFSEDDYCKKYGLKPTELFKYVINSSTVISSERLEGYIFKFVLSTESAKYFKREVSATAGAQSDAEFSEIECTIEIDNEWNIIRTTTKERYKLAIFGNIVCNSTSTEEFTLNNDVSIPDRELFQKYISVEDDNDNGSASSEKDN